MIQFPLKDYILHPNRNHMLYSLVETQRQFLTPMRMLAQYNKTLMGNELLDHKLWRTIGANFELFERITRQYPKPEFGIKETLVDGKPVKIAQKTVIKQTFCNLLNFEKQDFSKKQPKMLIVAPMSGHYATLLRGTVEGLLPHYDVYITDWLNPRDIPLERGEFHFDDYVTYVIEFMKLLAPNLNVLAVCQPSVPVLAAISLMSENGDVDVPKTLTMMGGPIDTRKSPTEVNDYAAERHINWFESNVITKVPLNYAGAGRYVYPGFMQLLGFLSMNLQTHMDQHLKFYYHLIDGDGENVASHKKFYNEYLAVMDLPAEFYLETVNIVFKKHSLPRGALVCNEQVVRPSAIKKTALLCIEGEKDDISGRGQTKAALDICTGLSTDMKQYHLQKGVGHYGIFNGRKYREEVVPTMKAFIDEQLKK